MNEKFFSLTADTKYLEVLADFIEQAMKKAGWDVEMELKKPGNPQIWEFRKKDNVIAMSLNPHGGSLSGETEIKVETENSEMMDEIYEVVGDAIGTMATRYTKKVFDAIKSKKGKLTIISTISKHIDELKKDVV